MGKTCSTKTDSCIRYGIVVALIWSLLIAYSLLWDYRQHQEEALALGRMKGQAFFEKDLLYRRWASRHGGVYVPVTESTPPNPNLSHIPERDLTTPSGRRLTLINPAYMTRQVFELQDGYLGTGRGHITSLKPIRADNAPDAWEQKALLSFEQGATELGQLATMDGKIYYRYMRPFVTEKPCLKCHQAQGYLEGDVRGGLSVSVAMEPFYHMMDKEVQGVRINHAIIWLLGIGLIGFGTRRLDRNTANLHEKTAALEYEIEQRKKSQEQLQERTSQLEKEIASRNYAQEALKKQTMVLEEEIEKHKLTERERQYLSEVYDKSLDEIYIFDFKTLKFIHLNRGALANLQYTFAEIVNLTPVDIKPDFTEAAFHKFIAPLLDGTQEVLVFRSVHQRADATTYPVEVHLQLVESGGGRVFLANVFDITERKRAEEENSLLEAQLQQAQKLESVGRLAGGVAHDFNNILTVVQGYSQLGIMEVDPAQPLFSYLEEISKAAERAAGLTRQLLAFARRQTIAPKVVNLNQAVAGMLNMLQRLIGENILLDLHPATELWPVKIDPSQIDQLLANLCVNARDAMTDVGRITISTENLVIEAEPRAGMMQPVTPGEYVRLTVSDNGSGMDSETLAHIFEPFFTTKGVGEGTGLGLATVFGIVKQNNGYVSASSEPGSGTTLTIDLPRHLGSPEEKHQGGLAEPVPCGKETILVVEDDQAILEMVTIILTRQGYTVLQANSPTEAVRLAKEHADRINLLITDMIMPEMNGKELAHTLLQLNPQLNCLFMSGYTADTIARHGVLEDGINFIQKPFTLPALAARVRELFDDNLPSGHN